MSVKNQHPDYKKMASKWERCRATVEGQDAVHDKGSTFLPMLKDQTAEDYKAYKLRALFYNAVWRTVEGMAGMLFRKPPVVDVAASISELLEDVTLAGVPFHVFLQQIVLDVLSVGRIGVLVDYPTQVIEGATVAEAQGLNLRPTMQMYPAGTIINWRTERVNNQYLLTLVVLTEQHSELKDQFEEITETRYRVLDLFNGAYRQRVFRVENGKEDEQIGPDIFPLMNGKPLDFIPFIFLGTDDTTSTVNEPPLIDLVDVNLAHYRLNADYFHGLHFTGLPTAVVSGYTPENPGDKLYIGSSSAWVFPDPQAKAAYLEYTGQGLTAIEKALEKLEQYMAILGARLLSAEKKMTETAQTAQIHRAGESSILSAIAQTISLGMTKALGIFCDWAGATTEASVELNRDFLPVDMTPQELTALVSAWQSGAMSHESLFDQLQQREVVKSDLTFEEEQARISANPPVGEGVKEPYVGQS